MNQILIVVDVEYHLHDVCWFMSIDTHFRHKLYELSITFKNNGSLMIWVWWQRKHKTIFKDVINIHFYIIQPNRNISNHIEEGNHIWILLAVIHYYIMYNNTKWVLRLYRIKLHQILKVYFLPCCSDIRLSIDEQKNDASAAT